MMRRRYYMSLRDAADQERETRIKRRKQQPVQKKGNKSISFEESIAK